MSEEKKEIIENVLILQGGGSLGAFGCGVYKALTKHHVDLDLIAGTSIGGVNAAIIAGSRNSDRTAQILEEFWIELSESFVELEKSFSFSNQMKQFIVNDVYPYHKNDTFSSYLEMKKGQRIKIKQLESFYSSANFGNEKFFKPRWFPEFAVSDP
ncbi:MAG TPA: patatin-like phospholipase family protein, partial [Candidatus Nitrosocosmicus sp.]|nr:patatin-like phospholipase family protein [Candidatus Nitrosocosmicus sp.]